MFPNYNKNLHHTLPSVWGFPINQRYPPFCCTLNLTSVLVQLPRCWQVSCWVSPVSREFVPAQLFQPAPMDPPQSTAELGSQDHQLSIHTLKGQLVQLSCNDQTLLELDQIAQSLVIPDHECLQRWGIYYLSEKAIPLFNHPHCKELLPCI